VERIEKTFTRLQGRNALVSEQREELSKPSQDIFERMNIDGPLGQEDVKSFHDALAQNPSCGYLFDKFCVKKRKILEAIDEAGEFVQTEIDKLYADEETRSVYNSLVHTIAIFSLQFVAGITKVVAERDEANSATDELPPVLPLELCSFSARDFTTSLQQQKIRLNKKLTDEEIEQIGKEFRELRVAFREEGGMQQMLEDAQSNCKSTGDSFQTCWKPLGNKFKKLRQYCGGVASVMPGTSSVESDFSIINWTKDSHSNA
jgi:hypothetical protein